MNIQKFTQKSIEAVNGCEKIALEYGNQEIEQEHLLYALMTIEDSLIAKLIENSDIFRQRPALTRNSHLSQFAANRTGGERVLFIRLLTQKFEEL